MAVTWPLGQMLEFTYDLVHSAQMPVQSPRQSGREGDVPESISQVWRKHMHLLSASQLTSTAQS